MHRLWIAVFALVVTAVVSYVATSAIAGEPTNLKVYPPGTSKKAIKKDMKRMSKDLGVQCKFCHDTRDMAKDTKHKDVARDMMRMVQSLNARELADSPVTCNTCHRGQPEPSH